MKEIIQQWLEKGADLDEGIRLFYQYGKNEPFKRLLRHNPRFVEPQLRRELATMAGITAKTFSKPSIFAPRRTFREQWAFLSANDCPGELKILANDKITAYRAYTQAHSELFNCVSLTDCRDKAKEVLDNFIENDRITKEFAFYKEHRRVLGLHPIFSLQKRIEELKNLGPVKLVERKKKLEHNIWRIESELKKGARADLVRERQQRMANKKNELQEINKLLELYV